MNLSAKVASALSFAHLAGLGRSKASKAEDDDKKDRDHEDGDVKKGKKADADEPDEDDKKKDGPDASAEDDEPDAEGDDPEKKDDDKKDAKAKAADGDDEDDKDEDKMKAGAKAERARCAAIFAAPAAAKNVALAAELAFATDLSAAQAIGILGKAPAASVGHPNRAAANPRVGSGGVPEVTGKQAVDSRWDRAFASVNPQRRK